MSAEQLEEHKIYRTVDMLYIYHLLLRGYFPTATKNNSSNGRLKKVCLISDIINSRDDKLKYYLNLSCPEIQGKVVDLVGPGTYRVRDAPNARHTLVGHLRDAEVSSINDLFPSCLTSFTQLIYLLFF